jgi:HEPN domain-containing protein
LTVQFQFVALGADRAYLRPRLKLQVGAKNEHDKRLMLLSLFGPCMVSGRGGIMGQYMIGNFTIEQPVMVPVTTPQSQPMPIYLAMDLDQHLVRRIEELRDGGDLQLTITLYCAWAAIGPTGEFAEPIMDSQTVTDRDRSQTIRIPQTDWLRTLEGLRYGKYTVFEIETPLPPTNDVLAEAVEHLSQARRLFDEGNYEESMVRCRRAIDAAVENIEAKTGRKLAEIMESGSRAEFVKGLASKTKTFVAPAAHSGEEPTPPEPKNREDARLAVLMAYASVAYVASFLSKTARQ